MKIKLIVIGIFLLAAFFRLYDPNWDQGQHLHPDERFLTMVATDISWPKDIGEYLDTDISPLNPHNRGFGFFVYGTFPVFFTKWVAESLGKGDYGNLALVGRQLSAFADLVTVLLVFLIGKEILKSTNSQFNKFSNKKKSSLLDNLKLDNWIIGLFAAFLYAAMVLPIQLSHFYAVDTYLTFFITLSFYLLVKIIQNKLPHPYPLLLGEGFRVRSSSPIQFILLGLSFGLSLASKISAILFLPIIFLSLSIIALRSIKTNSSLTYKLFNFCYVFLLFAFCFLLFAYLAFRLAQPYAFANGNIFDLTLNPKVLANWKQLEGFMKPDSGFPPSVQWFGIKPFLFPFASLILWGLGLPLGIISLIAIGYGLWVMGYGFIKNINKKSFSQLTTHNSQLIIFLSLLWILLLFLFQSSQPAPTIRYYQPIYPFLAIISGLFLYQLSKIKYQRYISNRKIFNILYVFFIFSILFFILIWPVSFINIYSRPHSRVSASEWIYNNLPVGSTIAAEHWDDGLPLTLDDKRINQLYKFVSLPLYDPDKPEKWPKIAKSLSESDYIILSSNRLWGSITKAPQLFPQTSRYYHLLFDGSLGFEKIAETASFPSLSLPLGNNCLYLLPPQEEKLELKTDKGGFIRFDGCDIYNGITYQGIVVRDEISEETFTVYDHPKVLIFKKVKPMDYLQLLDDGSYKN